MGREGVASKSVDSLYEGCDYRRDTWLKSRCPPSQEVVIGGWEADGARFKAVLTGVYEGDALTYFGHVGARYPRLITAGLLTRLPALEVDAAPFGAGGPPHRGVHWVKPALVAIIEIAEWIGAGKLRKASLKELRKDKPAFGFTNAGIVTNADEPASAHKSDAGEPMARPPLASPTDPRSSIGEVKCGPLIQQHA